MFSEIGDISTVNYKLKSHLSASWSALCNTAEDKAGSCSVPVQVSHIARHMVDRFCVFMLCSISIYEMLYFNILSAILNQEFIHC